jgi:hypothetical protein
LAKYPYVLLTRLMPQLLIDTDGSEAQIGNFPAAIYPI